VEKHSAQIFCEMLAQVCRKEFWEIHKMKYQEVRRHSFLFVDNIRLLLFMPRMTFSISIMPSSRMHIFRRLFTMVPTSDRIPRNASRYTDLENITCNQRHTGSTFSRSTPSFYGILQVEKRTSGISLITMIILCINMYSPVFCCSIF
jgi:hypothetical protein